MKSATHTRWYSDFPVSRCLFFAVAAFLAFDIVKPVAADETPERGRNESVSSPTMTMEVTINRPGSTGRGYRRPYVAAWFADKDGFPVRTLLLWVQSTGPGPRWIPDLRQWYRDDRLRRIVDDQDLVDAVSSPTRSVGTYKVSWDGNDDLGQPLPPGEYTLLVEAAREHGTYQLIREKLTLGTTPFRKEIAGNVEIKSVVVSFTGLKKTP